MKFVEEVVVETFLPTVRSMLAEALRDRGLTQREVAEALGISQSAVSKYAQGEVDREPAVLAHEQVQSVVEELADGLASGEMTQVQALVELEVLIRKLEHGELLATLHEQAMPALAGRGGDFSVHDPDSELRTTQHVLASIRRGLAVLERTPNITELVPNVGSNLVECTPNPQDIDDVAGVPGRLFDVSGRLAVPGEPAFGASAHVASVLLAARAGGSTARGALNLRYGEELIRPLAADGSAVEFDGETGDVERAVREAITNVEEPAAVSVLYQTGGFGVEPIIYLLGSDAVAVARRVRAIR